MTIKGRITLLFNADGLHLEIRDDEAGLKFIEIKVNTMKTCQLLSRLSHVECEIDIKSLDKIGKKMEINSVQFEISRDIDYLHSVERDKVLYELAKNECLKRAENGWEPDKNFNSKNSIVYKDGKTYCTAVIRRWV